ncbi:hypothetical protein SAMN04490248_115103 [Salinihabitans flavidus]|uniref:Uncharacterized protein n=1 Tax=Salinihabitans flavidus TaxID=569882 RepID=A0A1H8TIK9_9RHOB|nr:hypothetical protein [Salinihabitans flavidus]SEO90403.1 hypothetical protein SAMN04490248_115103 [Salinihabitans flavidus]
MIPVLTAVLSGLGRRAALWGALALAVVAALWIAVHRGRRAAQAAFIIRRADARIRAMQTAREIRHEVRTADRAELERRAERWMRD